MNLANLMHKPTTIIGHRGAAGLELENTFASFKHAIAIGVDAIEFDVHRTRDGRFVVCHDPDLSRISSSAATIKDLTYAELQYIELHNGQHVPLLHDVLALATAKQMPVIVELKIDDHIEDFCQVLDDFPEHSITVASFLHPAIEEVRRLRPQLPIFIAEKRHPLEVVKKAKQLDAAGMDLNVSVLNPLTYWLAKRANIQIMVYTVDNLMLGKLVKLLYPDVQICTNQPKRFLKEDSTTAERLKWYTTPTFARQLRKVFNGKHHV